MRSLELSPRDRRALQVGAMVLATLVTTRAILPVVTWRVESLRRSDVILESATAARHAALHLHELRATVGALRDDVRLAEKRILPAGSVGTAGAALAALLSDAAEAAGVRLESTQTVATVADSTGASSASAYPIVRVRANGAGDIEGIATLLELIESDSLLMIVRELQISQPQVALPDDQPETLVASFVVEARMRRAKRTS